MRQVLETWRCGLVAAISLLVFIGWLVAPALPRFSQEQCGVIELGMTKARVEEVLGRCAGDYATGLVFYCPHGQWDLQPAVTTEEWQSDTGTIRVGFDAEGLVVWKCFEPGMLAMNWWEYAYFRLYHCAVHPREGIGLNDFFLH